MPLNPELPGDNPARLADVTSDYVSPIITDTQGQAIVSPGYYPFIKGLEKTVICKGKSGITPISDLEELILSGNVSSKDLLKDLQKWKLFMSPKEYNNHGGSMRPHEGTIIKVGKGIIDLADSTIGSALRVARKITAGEGKSILDYFSTNNSGRVFDHNDYLAMAVKIIDIQAVKLKLVDSNKRFTTYTTKSLLLKHELGGYLILLLVVNELVSEWKTDAKSFNKKMGNISADMMGACPLYDHVIRGPSEMKDEIEVIAKSLNKRYLTLSRIVGLYYSLTYFSGEMTKKELLGLGFSKKIFSNQGIPDKIVRETLSNPKVKRVTEKPGRGYEIKRSLLRFNEFITEVIKNAQKY